MGKSKFSYANPGAWNSFLRVLRVLRFFNFCILGPALVKQAPAKLWRHITCLPQPPLTREQFLSIWSGQGCCNLRLPIFMCCGWWFTWRVEPHPGTRVQCAGETLARTDEDTWGQMGMCANMWAHMKGSISDVGCWYIAPGTLRDTRTGNKELSYKDVIFWK